MPYNDPFKKRQHNKTYFAMWYKQNKAAYARKRKASWKKWHKKHKEEYNRARREKYARRNS